MSILKNAHSAEHFTFDIENDSGECNLTGFHSHFYDLVNKLEVVKEREVADFCRCFDDFSQHEYVESCLSVVESDSNFSSDDENLIVLLDCAKNIDIIRLVSLKYRIQTASQNWMHSFIACGGVNVIVESMDNALQIIPLTRTNAFALNQLMQCIRIIIEKIGLDVILNTRGALDVFVMAIDFSRRDLSMEILELLSVICFNGNKNAMWEIELSINHIAKLNKQRPFETFVDVLNRDDSDLELRVAVLSFLNHYIMGLSKISSRVKARYFLESVGLSTTINKILLADSVNNSSEHVENHQPISVSEEVVGELHCVLQSRSPRRNAAYIPPTDSVEGGCYVLFQPSETHAFSYSHQVSGSLVGTVSKCCCRLLVRAATIEIWNTTCSSVDQIPAHEAPVLVISARQISRVQYFTTAKDLQDLSKASVRISRTDGSFVHLGFDDDVQMEAWASGIQRALEYSRGEILSSMEQHRLDQIYSLRRQHSLESFEQQLIKECKLYLHCFAVDNESIMNDTQGLLRSPLKVLDYIELQLIGYDSKIRSVFIRLINSMARGCILGHSESEDTGQCVSDYFEQMLEKSLSILESSGHTKAESSPFMRIQELESQLCSLNAKLKASEGLLRTPISGQKSDAIIGSDDQFASRRCLQNEQVDRWEPFRNMKASIQRKMHIAGFSKEEIHAFLGNIGVNPDVISAVKEENSSKASQVSAVPVILAPINEPTPSDNSQLQKFRKMQKMGVPEGAIRNKMSQEGLSSKEIDSFFSDGNAESTPNLPSPDASAVLARADSKPSKFAKFEKMLKMHIPEGAVKQKMSSEGFSAQEIDSFIAGESAQFLTNSLPKPTQSSTEQSNNSPPSDPPAQLDDKYKKYTKMLAMHIPEGAVRQKMISDGLKDAEIDIVFPPKVSNMTINNDCVVAPVAVVSANQMNGLGKYVKMKQLHIPDGAIRQKMLSDGISVLDIDNFFSVSDGSMQACSKSIEAKLADPPNPFPPKLIHSPSKKMRAVFVTKMDSRDVEQSIWATISEKNLPWEDIENSFGEDKGTSGIKPEVQRSGKDSKAPASGLALFDAKRSQNVSISFTATRKTPEDLRIAAIDMNPNILTRDLTEVMLSIAPTSEEIALLVGHEADALDVTGRVFQALSAIPRLKERLACQLITFTWEQGVFDIERDIQIINNAIEEIHHSQSEIKELLSVSLAVVNYLNAGSSRQQQHGLKLESLAKLDTVKVVPGRKCRGNLLNFIAKSFAVASSNGQVTSYVFLNDWHFVWDCPRINLKQLSDNLKELKGKLKQCKDEINASSSFSEMYKTPLIHRLDQFLDHSDSRVIELEHKLVDTTENVVRIRREFGESETCSGSDCISATFFSVIAEFMKKLKLSHQQNTEWMEAELRAQRRQSVKQSISVKVASTRAISIGLHKGFSHLVGSISFDRNTDHDHVDEPTGNAYEQLHATKVESTEKILKRFLSRQRAGSGMDSDDDI